jgi:hypothetical protein
MVDRHVASHSEDPRPERRPARLVLRELRQQLGEDLLRHVVGVVAVADDAPDVGADTRRVAQVELAHRVAIAALCLGDQAAYHRFALAVSSAQRGVGRAIGPRLTRRGKHSGSHLWPPAMRRTAGRRFAPDWPARPLSFNWTKPYAPRA